MDGATLVRRFFSYSEEFDYVWDMAQYTDEDEVSRKITRRVFHDFLLSSWINLGVPTLPLPVFRFSGLGVFAMMVKGMMRWVLVYQAVEDRLILFHPVIGNGALVHRGLSSFMIDPDHAVDDDVRIYLHTGWKRWALSPPASTHDLFHVRTSRTTNTRDREAHTRVFLKDHLKGVPGLVRSLREGRRVATVRHTRRTPAQSRRERDTDQAMEFLRRDRGFINKVMRFLTGRGNRCSARATDPVSCILRTQCYATTHMVHYFFGYPVWYLPSSDDSIDPSVFPFTVEDVVALRKDSVHNIINVEISIGATHDGFPGHVFNIVFLLRESGPPDIFWIQSYILKYSVLFRQISPEMCTRLFQIYFTLFFDRNRSNIFLEDDDVLWRIVTDAPLHDYYKQSLTGAYKPTANYIGYSSMRQDDTKDWYRRKAIALIESARDKIRRGDRKHLQQAFGEGASTVDVIQAIDHYSENLNRYLSSPDKKMKSKRSPARNKKKTWDHHQPLPTPGSSASASISGQPSAARPSFRTTW